MNNEKEVVMVRASITDFLRMIESIVISQFLDHDLPLAQSKLKHLLDQTFFEDYELKKGFKKALDIETEGEFKSTLLTAIKAVGVACKKGMGK